jgi:ABC-2 type transport system ATP-binding protein
VRVSAREPDTPAASERRRAPAVVAAGLSKRYGERVAVDRIDLEIPAGVVSGFVGPNGAGKTTTIRMLLGLISPSSGSARVLGHPVTRPAAYLARVGALIEAPAFYPTLSGVRNLEVLARLGRLERGRAAQALAQVGLADRADDLVRSYSLGMRQRLGVAAALLPAPELVILDEPANGLDPAGIREIRTLLRDLADRGTTVLVSSHLLSEVEAICDHLVMIDQGQIVFHGGIEQLLKEQRAELLAIPEHPADLAALVSLATRAGKHARVDGDRVRIQAAGDWAAELNRCAMRAGITLRGLQEAPASLEEAFFSITGQAERQPQ